MTDDGGSAAVSGGESGRLQEKGRMEEILREPGEFQRAGL